MGSAATDQYDFMTDAREITTYPHAFMPDEFPNDLKPPRPRDSSAEPLAIHCCSYP